MTLNVRHLADLALKRVILWGKKGQPRQFEG